MSRPDGGARFQDLVEKIREGVYESDAEGRLTFANGALAAILGFDGPDELLGIPFYDFLQPVELERTREMYARSLRTGEVNETVSVGARARDGSTLYLEILPTPIVEAGAVVGSRGTVRDVTDVRIAQEELARSRTMLQLVLDSIPVGVFWKDREGRYLGANRAAAVMADLADPTEVVGKTDRDFAWRDLADAYRVDDQEVMASGKPLPPYRETVRTEAGRHLALETAKFPLTDARGEIVGVLGVSTDVGQRVEAERELRLLTRAVEESTVLILITDPMGIIRYANRAWSEATGYSRDEAVGKSPRLLKSRSTPPATYAALWGALGAGKSWRGQMVNRRKDGSTYVEEKFVTPLLDEEGEPEAYISFGTDISAVVGLQE